MKRLSLTMYLVFLVCLGSFSLASAEQSIKFNDSLSGVTLLEQNEAGLTLSINIGKIDFISVSTPEGPFVLAKVDGFSNSQRIGEPRLPMVNRLLSIPYGCELEAEVIASDVEVINLADYGITDRLIPLQPSVSKSQDPATLPFEFNRAVYQTSGFYALPPTQSTIEGIMRGLRLGMVLIAPIEYNPTQNTMRVYKNLTVRVSYRNPDWVLTRQLWKNYYSPFFEPVYETIINYESPLLANNDLTKYPVKYLIISHRMFEAQLQPFIAWKIKKGFNVVTAYTDVIGTTNTAIKSYIQNQYQSGTPQNPAPTFVLLVGDAQQIPPFQFSGHVSDLSFCEFTGDNIPEIYYGRFSAENTGNLQPQIDKTLEYEKYLMPDPSFLGEVTLVSGVDPNYAATYGNGQINYGTNYYFNPAHGITTHTWLYPASDASGVAAQVIATVNNGIGIANYTAHGSHDGWSDPSFTSANAGSLTNAHKYPLMIGNCCVTNTFGTDYSTPCFGEALLRGANKGAIGYIGASDNSYWDEDYWWGVGYGPVVGAGPTYAQTGLGAYDGLFHDHGEPVTSHYVVNDAINFCGNLAVTQSGSSRIAYYWQIYHLMGDPSVATYLHVPTSNAIAHSSTILLPDTSFTVQAEAGSYVGITYNGVLHGAGYVDQTGSVQVRLMPFAAPCTAEIVVTAQNKIPYTASVQVISPAGAYLLYQSSAVNDELGNSDGLLNNGEAVKLGVGLINVGPDDALEVVTTLSSTDPYVTITDNSEN
ncbi:MAG: C25 family cysteine peptidase, partial [candidate division Zixibacteria bacterium]|nr:C25 family cysteine peptidase [candidate division Zixibacteria bacterium]